MSSDNNMCYSDRLFPIQDFFSNQYSGNEPIEKVMLSTIRHVIGVQQFNLVQDEEISIEKMSVSPTQRSLLQFLIQASRSKTILEIGTFIGVSALYMAAVLPSGGRVITIEKFDRFADIAEKNFKQNGLSDKISLIRGDAIEQLEGLSFSIDFVFIDGDKERYLDYFKKVDLLLSPGGIVVVDDVFFHGDVLNNYPSSKKGRGVKKLLEHMATDHNYTRSLLPIDNGLLLLRKSVN